MKQNDYQQYAWLVVFVPALFYYLFVFTLRVDSRWEFLSSLELSQPFFIVATKGWIRHHTLLQQVETIVYIQKNIGAITKNVTENSQQRFSIPSSSVTNTSIYNLYYPMESVIRATDSISYDFHSLLWRHDPDLGRGYLLISDALNSGRVWRWEVGGGPITIGRSLFIEKSGCRSGIWNPCPTTTNDESDWFMKRSLFPIKRNNSTQYPRENETTTCSKTTTCPSTPVRLGSSGLALQPSKQHKNSWVGSLIVAELGERRIVRIEENGGTRTPIVIQVPTLCSNSNSTMDRLNVPGILTITPAGHLLFTDSSTCNNVIPTIGGVYRIMDISKIPPLPTHLNRESHTWKTTFNQSYSNLNTGSPIELIFHNKMSRISALAISKDVLFVGGNLQTVSEDFKYVIYKVPLHESIDDLKNKYDDDDDDDEKTDLKKEISHETLECNHTTEMTCDTNFTYYDEPKSKIQGLYDDEALLFVDMSEYFQGVSITDAMSVGPSVTVDSLGNVYATYPGGILIFDYDAKLITSIMIDDHLQDRIPTSIALGLDDGYLYVSTKTSLLRIRIKTKPFLQPFRGKQKQ